MVTLEALHKSFDKFWEKPTRSAVHNTTVALRKELSKAKRNGANFQHVIDHCYLFLEAVENGIIDLDKEA